jgi:hypothetical protein
MAKSHNATGRSVKGWKPSREAKRARPPEGSSWIWLTLDMLESPAWRAMRLAARKIVDRLIIEHLTHAGKKTASWSQPIRTFNGSAFAAARVLRQRSPRPRRSASST